MSVVALRFLNCTSAPNILTDNRVMQQGRKNATSHINPKMENGHMAD